MESIWTEFATLDTRETLVYRPSPDLSQKLIGYYFLAGAGKSVLWYVIPSIFRLDNLHWRPVPQSSRRSKTCKRPGWRHSPCSTTTSARKKRRTFVGCSHRFSFSFAVNPIPIMLSFPHFIRRTTVVLEAPAMTNSVGV